MSEAEVFLRTPCDLMRTLPQGNQVQSDIGEARNRIGWQSALWDCKTASLWRAIEDGRIHARGLPGGYGYIER